MLTAIGPLTGVELSHSLIKKIMKTHQKYWALSIVTALTLTGSSLGALSSAQTVTPLTCTLGASSVTTNQAMIMTAAGGNGTYAWSGPNLSVTNGSGSQFAVSYPNAGVYTITVASAGLTATCNLNVTAPVSTGNLTCSPATQNVVLGQVATFGVIGGNGSYTWSSPDLNVTNATGSGFSANYATSGLKTLTVTSAGLTATCAVNVLGGVVVTPPVITPGLPNTGGGYNQ